MTVHVCLFLFDFVTFMFHGHVSRVPEMNRLDYYGVRAEYASCVMCACEVQKALLLKKRKEKKANVIWASALFLFHVLHHSSERRGFTSGDLTGVSQIWKGFWGTFGWGLLMTWTWRLNSYQKSWVHSLPSLKHPWRRRLETNLENFNTTAQPRTSSLASSIKTWSLFCPSDVLIPDPWCRERSSTF